jgi:hypothetical protein
MVKYNGKSKNGQCLPQDGHGPAKHSGRRFRSLKPREDSEYDPSVLIAKADRSGLPRSNGTGSGAAKDVLGGKRDLAAPPAATKVMDESFLVNGHDNDGGSEASDAASCEDGEAVDQATDDWYGSEACQRISLPGSEALPGNRHLRIPQWVLYYFRNIEMAVVFAQLLYWFERTKDGKRRARRKDEQGRSVVDKTHRQLADELGIPNKRRVEDCLRFFALKERKKMDKGKDKEDKQDAEDERIRLLDYRTTGIGKGRTTRIWLIPAGILEAYRIGCRRAEEAEK